MEKRSFILGLVLSIFLIVNVSAGVYFSQQPEADYNLGDIMDITLDISPLEDGQPIKIELVCEDSYLVSYDSSPTSTFDFKLPLNFINMPDLEGGSCNFLVGYSGQSYTSRSFQISKKLNLELNTDSFVVKPGEEIIILGRVERLSGEGIDGEVEIDIPLLELADQKVAESLEEEGWKKEALTIAKDKLKEEDYFYVYEAVEYIYGNIDSEDDIQSVKISKEEVSSMEAEKREAIVFQKIRVKYEILEDVEEENETVEKTVEKVVYLSVDTIINDGEVDSQDFEESNEIEEEDEEQIEVDNGMFFGTIVDGGFSVPFSLTENTPAGSYRIDVYVYEEDSFGRKTSEGFAMANLKILQILTEITIALGNSDLDPGQTLSFKPTLIDQAGYVLEEDTAVIIQNEKLIRLFEKIIPSDETVEYEIPTNLTSGYYEIEVSGGEMIDTKKFYVNEKAIISFKILNQTLIVTNIGNIPYKKNIQINLGEESFIKKVNLDLGEDVEFRLEGYEGQYDVWVSDGENEISQSSVSLTGNAVNVKAIESGLVILKTPIIWIFFIIILGAGVLFTYRNVFKKKSITFPFKNLFHRKPKIAKLEEHGKIIKEEGKKVDLKKPDKKEVKSSGHHKAEPVLVLRGDKNRATVVALKIKNKITKTAKAGLENAIEHVYEKKGAVYERGDYIFLVFSPLMTRSFKNEVQAVKSAEKIRSALKEYNKKFKDKIEFGIGVNSGNIISKIENKKLKFTALGNLMGPAKRLADSSREDILITKETYERGISEIKAQKKQIKGSDIYEVRRIMDQEKNKKFIQGFLKRMENEGS